MFNISGSSPQAANNLSEEQNLNQPSTSSDGKISITNPNKRIINKNDDHEQGPSAKKRRISTLPPGQEPYKGEGPSISNTESPKQPPSEDHSSSNIEQQNEEITTGLAGLASIQPAPSQAPCSTLLIALLLLIAYESANSSQTSPIENEQNETPDLNTSPSTFLKTETQSNIDGSLKITLPETTISNENLQDILNNHIKSCLQSLNLNLNIEILSTRITSRLLQPENYTRHENTITFPNAKEVLERHFGDNDINFQELFNGAKTSLSITSDNNTSTG